jgi:hypothetical protein
MCEISRVLEVEHLDDSEDQRVSDIVCYKYARLVSCDVEHTFSQCKSLFPDNQQGFAIHKLRMTFDHCNSAPLSV